MNIELALRPPTAPIARLCISCIATVSRLVWRFVLAAFPAHGFRWITGTPSEHGR